MAKRKNQESEENPKMKCKICGKKNEIKSRMCMHCGAFLPRGAEVDATMAALNKKYRKEEGDNLICRMGKHPFYASKLPVISTGSLKLDKALVGGYPMTSRVMLAGDENSGKTTLALECVAEVQAMGGTVVYIDVEHALDGEYAARIGVNLEELIIAKPESGTEALDYILAMAPVADLIVLDSLAACASVTSVDKEVKVDADGTVKQPYDVGDLARLMSGFQPKLMATVAKTTCTYIFINQLRTKINPRNPAYSAQEPMGGRAPKYFCNIILRVRTAEELFEDSVYLGRQSQVKIVRAKHLGRYQVTDVKIGNAGVDKFQEVIDLALEYEILTRAGSWYSFADKWRVQGMDSVRGRFEKAPDDLELVEKAVKAKIEEAHAAAKAYGTKFNELISDGEEDGE